MTTWRGPAGCDAGHCLLVSTDVPGLADGYVAIRNSHRRATVVCDREEWTTFIVDVKAGRYDDLCDDGSGT